MDGPVWALGLMSGTSMDGIDAAALLTDGVEVLGFGPKRFEPLGGADREVVRAAQGLWPGEEGVSAAAAIIDQAHAEMVVYFPTTEVVGFHGQTLAHDPVGQRSHQAGDGAALARAGGKTVVWDFRTADLASGGEGAPLAPFYHHACARMLGLDDPVAFLNIGGVANATWVDPAVPRPDATGALMAMDTGPGNALIDDLMAARRGEDRDEAGALAATGAVDQPLLSALLKDPFFDKPAPKSLDRNHFNGVLDRLKEHSDADAAATLAAFSAGAVAASVRHMPAPPSRWLVCGGGRNNITLMRMIAAHTNVPVEAVETLGLDGDFLEAQAFAYLAVRVLRGLPTSAPATTGARLPVSGGRISAP
ncbi:MAG: anhydro-N-acetylmuramic acid kinase [Pseudomonadota bacterium]